MNWKKNYLKKKRNTEIDWLNYFIMLGWNFSLGVGEVKIGFGWNVKTLHNDENLSSWMRCPDNVDGDGFG